MESPIYMEDLNKLTGIRVSEEVLLNRNYFLCKDGEILKYNTNVHLKDFPDLETSVIQEDYEEGQPSSATVMKYVAESLYEEAKQYQDELYEDEPDYEDLSWFKCLPMPPEYMQCQSYIIIQIYLDQESRISFFRIWMRVIEGGIPFYCIPGDCSDISSSYRPLPFFPPEVLREVLNLCEEWYLPNNVSLIGRKISPEMRKKLHLDCANKNEYFFCNMSGFTDVSNTICITVDNKESNIITELEVVTNVNERMMMKPIDADTDILDVLDCMTILYDYINKDERSCSDEEIIQDFATAWKTLDAELINKHLDNSFQYDSQWVLESLDAEGYKKYIRGKFETLKKHGEKLDVRIVADRFNGGKMLHIIQNGNHVYYRIIIDRGKVIKGDLCLI